MVHSKPWRLNTFQKSKNWTAELNDLQKILRCISLKDHKPNYQSLSLCRLINPSKSDLSKISKSIFDRINQNLRNKLQFNQWKNSENVIDWFKKIKNKNNYVFIKVWYCPILSIFAENHAEITGEEKSIICPCQKTLLFYKNEPWKEKHSDSCFDVTIGSYDSAEFCRLYEENDLMVQKYINGPEIDQLRKKIIKIFKEIDFKIDIETNCWFPRYDI